MGITAVALGLSMGLSLTACSDDAEPESESSPGSSTPSASESLADPSAPETEVGSLDCPQYEQLATKIVDTQSQLYAPSADGDPSAAIDELVAELETLKEGAPADVQEAVTSLSEGFRQAADLLASPDGRNQTELLTLATELSEDSGTITAYIAKQCEAG